MAKTTIHSDYIPDNAITSTKIAENSIGAREIATNAITTLYVADGSVSSEKLASNIDIAGTFDVTGATTLDSTLSVSGNITGTLATAAQPNITSVGTLTGLDVAGTPTFDGLTVDGTGDFNIGTENVGINITSTDAGAYIGLNDNNATGFYLGTNAANFYLLDTGNSPKLKINSNGDISFYEDTGTTAKFFWDASAERLSVPTLSITDGSITTTAAAGDHTVFNSTGADADFRVRTGANTHSLYVEGNTGNVGIGTSSPSTFGKLSVYGSGTAPVVAVVSGTNSPASNATYGDIAFGSRTDGTLPAFIRGIANDNTNGTDGQITFYTADNTASAAATERMRIDASGNVGIATTTPAQKLHVTGNIYVGGGNYFTQATSGYFFGGSGSFTNGVYGVGTNNMAFNVNGSERMRIDSSGNLLISTISADDVNGAQIVNHYDFPKTGIEMKSNSTAGHFAMTFRNPNGLIGNIITTGSATAYNTSSDYRLKENVDYEFNALYRVAQLKPARFNFIADADKTVDGFLAHEVQDIVPEAVAGEKDAVDDEGNPVYQGIDQSKLVPLLTKAIQEQQELINNLTARIEQLEN